MFLRLTILSTVKIFSSTKMHTIPPCCFGCLSCKGFPSLRIVLDLPVRILRRCFQNYFNTRFFFFHCILKSRFLSHAVSLPALLFLPINLANCMFIASQTVRLFFTFSFPFEFETHHEEQSYDLSHCL